MNFFSVTKLFNVILFGGFFLLDVQGGTKTDPSILSKLDHLEKKIDQRLKSNIDMICQKYENNEPGAISEMQKMVETSHNPADVARGKKLLAEWLQKKQTEVWLNHPEKAGKILKIYLFKPSETLESQLQSIVQLHWKVNDLNDQYTRAAQSATIAKNQGKIDAAQKSINLASKILEVSKNSRNKANKSFEQQLMSQAVYSTDVSTHGLRLEEVNGEYIFFVLEVVANGKYIRTWCCRTTGGSELTIRGRKILIKPASDQNIEAQNEVKKN